MADDFSRTTNPIGQFELWLKEAEGANLPLYESFCLATADRSGRVTARMLLYKGMPIGDNIFLVTNYDSLKANQISENNQVALVFFWATMGRQVRIEGRAFKASKEISEQYFRSRPRESQVGAWASPQSEIIESREKLEARLQRFENQFKDQPNVPMPPNWGGYLIHPTSIEFWINRSGRLHERYLYSRRAPSDPSQIKENTAENSWEFSELAP